MNAGTPLGSSRRGRPTRVVKPGSNLQQRPARPRVSALELQDGSFSVSSPDAAADDELGQYDDAPADMTGVSDEDGAGEDVSMTEHAAHGMLQHAHQHQQQQDLDPNINPELSRDTADQGQINMTTAEMLAAGDLAYATAAMAVSNGHEAAQAASTASAYPPPHTASHHGTQLQHPQQLHLQQQQQQQQPTSPQTPQPIQHHTSLPTTTSTVVAPSPGGKTTAQLAQETYHNFKVDSAFAKRMSREPGLRHAEKRKPEQELNLARRSNVEALFAQIAGQLPPQQCSHCRKTQGPWTVCVVYSGQMMGSCANCWFNASGSRCSFHDKAMVQPVPAYIHPNAFVDLQALTNSQHQHHQQQQQPPAATTTTQASYGDTSQITNGTPQAANTTRHIPIPQLAAIPTTSSSLWQLAPKAQAHLININGNGNGIDPSSPSSRALQHALAQVRAADRHQRAQMKVELAVKSLALKIVKAEELAVAAATAAAAAAGDNATVTAAAAAGSGGVGGGENGLADAGSRRGSGEHAQGGEEEGSEFEQGVDEEQVNSTQLRQQIESYPSPRQPLLD